jgi:hypothetical protein
VSASGQQSVQLAAASAGATPEPIALPAAGGFAPALELPLPAVAITDPLSVVVQNSTPPASVPALDFNRVASGLRQAQAAYAAVPLLYVELYWFQTLQLPATPGFLIVVPPADIVSGVDYYLALFDPTRASLGWIYSFEGPASVAGSTLTFAGNSSPFTFVGGLGYWFALVAIPQRGSQPTPAPSVAPTSVPTQAPPTTLQTARSAYAFDDSVGINTHFLYQGTPYRTNYTQVRSLLVGSLIRHIRDGLETSADQTFYNDLNDLASAGIHSMLITKLGQTTANVNSFAAQVPQSIEAYEGPNEPDTSSDPNWAADTDAFQQQLFAALAGANPVIGPVVTTEAAYRALGPLSPYVTFGAFQNYYAGRNPGTPGWGATDSLGTYGSLSYQMASALQATPGKALVATESGYDDGGGSPYAVPAAVKARYEQRMLLLAFNAGVKRTYIYELADEGTGTTFTTSGLLDGSGNAKPAYYAVADLLGNLADTNASFVPSPLAFGLSADPSIQTTLLEQSNGTYKYLLWIETPSWDPVADAPITVNALPVTISFGAAPTSISAVTFNDTGSPAATTLIPVTSTVYSLLVSDHVTIISIKP